MRILRLFILFISVCFFTTMASAKEVFGLTQYAVSQQHTRFQQTESKSFSFINFLFEEEEEETSHENEEKFNPIKLSNDYHSFHFTHVESRISYVHAFPKQGFSAISTPIYIVFCNIRL